MMFGWTGNLLEVDLSSETFSTKRISTGILEKYIGGRGLGVKLYHDYVKDKSIDPLSSENPIIFAVGPLTGIVSMSGRHAVISKSPLTGTIFDCSSGGRWGKELHFCGLDAMVLMGESETPKILEIKEDEITLSQTNLWGKNIKETHNSLKNKGSIACIGKAGENKVLYACIMNDEIHAAGRGGLGAILGKKKLKAIVMKGSKKPLISSKEDLKDAKKEVDRLLVASPPLSKGLKIFGTAVLVNIINYMDIMPSANYTKVGFKDAEKISGEFIREHYDIGNSACYLCPIACKKHDKKRNLEIPEYETIWAFGSDCENNDFEKIIENNRICNDYGMDTITAGATLSAYMESKNFIEINSSNILTEIGEGKNNLLGKGSYRFAKSIGNENISMSIKKLELPGYDPRGLRGQSLSYATSNRGGCHLRAYMVSPEIIGKPKLIHRLNWEGKAGLVMIFQNLAATIDSLVMCKFSSFALSEEEYAHLLYAVTGKNYRGEDILKIGERIYNLERHINNEIGFEMRDDTLPKRMFGDINKSDFDNALNEYYQFRGWINGIPTREKLNELGIL